MSMRDPIGPTTAPPLTLHSVPSEQRPRCCGNCLHSGPDAQECARHTIAEFDGDLSGAAVGTRQQPITLWDYCRDWTPARGAGYLCNAPARHCGCRDGREKDLEALIEAGADLAQEMQTIVEEACGCEGVDVPGEGTGLARMAAQVEAWEAAYVRFGSGADPEPLFGALPSEPSIVTESEGAA